MSTWSNEMMTIDFRKVAKRFILIALCAIVVIVGVSGFLLRTQIGEMMQLVSSAGFYWHDDAMEHVLEMGMANGLITMPSLAAQTALLVGSLLFGLLAAAYWLLVAAWLYQLARRADMNGVLWLVAGLVANLVAVAVFFVVRSALRKSCSQCGGWSKKESHYCQHCGHDMQLYCNHCGHVVTGAEDYCPACGVPLEAATEE